MKYLPAQSFKLLADIPPYPYYYDSGDSIWSYICCSVCCCLLILIVIAAIVGVILLVSKRKNK